jgi:hypothetical protein
MSEGVLEVKATGKNLLLCDALYLMSDVEAARTRPLNHALFCIIFSGGGIRIWVEKTSTKELWNGAVVCSRSRMIKKEESAAPSLRKQSMAKLKERSSGQEGAERAAPKVLY